MKDVKKMRLMELTELWLENPEVTTEVIEELQNRFDEETVEEFILFFFEPMLRYAQAIDAAKHVFQKEIEKLLKKLQENGLLKPFQDIFGEITNSVMVNQLAKTTYNGFLPRMSPFTYAAFTDTLMGM